jgi:hypothetical protein
MLKFKITHSLRFAEIILYNSLGINGSIAILLTAWYVVRTRYLILILTTSSAGTVSRFTATLGIAPLNDAYIAVAIFGNATTALFVDRVGRRKFLLVGIIGCIVFLVLELAMVAKFVGTSNQSGLGAGGDLFNTCHVIVSLMHREVFALFGYIVFYSG